MRHGAIAFVAMLGCGGVDIEGAVYELDISDMEITGADPDLAPVLALFFVSPVLLQTHAADAEGFSARMAYADDADAQDPCVGTTELPAATMSDGAFSMGPATTDIRTTNSSFTIGQMEASGTFSEDWDLMDTLSLSGSIDLRQAVGFAGFTSGEGVCDTFDGLGLPCGACGDSEPFCADLEVTSLSAARVAIEVVAITAAEAAASCP